MRKWNAYIAGALVGLLAICSVVVSSIVLEKPKYLGTSTTFVRVAGLLEQVVAPQHVEGNEYFQKKKVIVDWQMFLVIGILVGAFIASRTDKSFTIELIPPMWQERFGKSILKRNIASFIGGAIALFGVRLAGGCPSGHGLSGMMQLSVSGLGAMIFFMVGGFITAHILFKGGK